MKFLAFFVLTIACASAASIANKEIHPRNIYRATRLEHERITNGETAATAQFPYQVGLLVATDAGYGFCGGSLINENYVLSAAHCFEDATGAYVLLGGTGRTSPSQLIQVTDTADMITHADYDNVNIQNDIALVKLETAAVLNSLVAVVPLVNSTTVDYSGQTAVVSGWGMTSDTSSVSDTLQYATLTIAPNTYCSRTYGSASFTTSNICAYTSNSTSTCSGDSGGPLVLSSTGEQIGIVSYGSATGCTLNYPVVFVRVSSYISWINEQTGLSF